MPDQDDDQILNRAYGVEDAEFVRPSDAEPARPPEQCQECGSSDIQSVRKLPAFLLLMLMLFAIGVAVDQLMAAFLLAIAGGIFFLIAPRWRCGSCGYRW
jgi:hypothetical protein